MKNIILLVTLTLLFNSEIYSNVNLTNTNKYFKNDIFKNKYNSHQVSSKRTKLVQAKLNSLGYKIKKVDGVIGQKTKKAIKEYQRDNQMKVSGIIDKKLLKSLDLNTQIK